jgi:hypothetical protein
LLENEKASFGGIFFIFILVYKMLFSYTYKSTSYIFSRIFIYSSRRKASFARPEVIALLCSLSRRRRRRLWVHYGCVCAAAAAQGDGQVALSLLRLAVCLWMQPPGALKKIANTT